MHAYLLVTCLLASACAYPEAGYSYNGLQSDLAQNAHQLKLHAHQQLPAENSFANFGASSNTYLAPLAAPASSSPANLQHLDTSSAQIGDTPQFLPLAHQEDSYNLAYQQSTHNQHAGGYAYAPQEATVHKHIYVHVPPKDFEDEDVITPHVRHQAAPKQKHYKIVFIKAPAAPSIRPPVISPPPQNEEKTLIYVLHKKPELQQDIVIPNAAPTKPSKPEVYFIKYKTKKEEAPVYGPPPPPPQQQQHQQHQEEQHQQEGQHQPVFLDMEPRHIEAPSAEYGVPTNENFAIAAPNVLDAAAPLTTTQTALATQTQQTFKVEKPSDVYGTPTASEEPQATLAAPSNLAPEKTQTMAPIVVEDTNVPTSHYGPPNSFYQKKKK